MSKTKISPLERAKERVLSGGGWEAVAYLRQAELDELKAWCLREVGHERDVMDCDDGARAYEQVLDKLQDLRRP